MSTQQHKRAGVAGVHEQQMSTPFKIATMVAVAFPFVCAVYAWSEGASWPYIWPHLNALFGWLAFAWITHVLLRVTNALICARAALDAAGLAYRTLPKEEAMKLAERINNKDTKWKR